MKKKSVWLASLLAAVLLAAGAVQAQDVDEKISALEQELQQLKESQIELKKEATAAAAAMPTFSYRPGNGMMIEAADKSWSWRTSFEAHMHWNFLQGEDASGRTRGEVWGRRFRPYQYFCVNNCLWEIEYYRDWDAAPSGNVDGSAMGRGAFHFNADRLNPYLPKFTAGMDISTAAAATISRQGSSATGAQREYDLWSRNIGPNTGAASNGISLTWDNQPLKSIGIPGRIGRIQFAMANVGEGGDGSSRVSDKKSFTGYFGIYPFSDLKNKWLSGLYFETGAHFCNVDGNPSAVNSSACTRMRVRDHGPIGNQTLFSTGTNSIGKGTYHTISPGLTWTVGPYRLRTMGGVSNGNDGGAVGANKTTPGKKRSHGFLIGHDLYVWSPKGFLTGSANTTGSVLLGYHFERTDAVCGDRTRPCALRAGHTLADFRRNRIILNEWDIWYVVAPRMSVGANFLWYDASNLTTAAANNLDISHSRPGKGGDWVDWSLVWRYQF